MKSIFLTLAVVLLFPHLSLSHTIMPNKRCDDGYTKGDIFIVDGNQELECLKISELGDSYKIIYGEKCAQDYAKTEDKRSSDKKNYCVKFSKLEDVYTSGSKSKCAPSYVRGRDNKCFKIAVTNKYRVKFSKKCGVDYVEGQIQGNKKECFKISILGNEYKTHSRGKCNFGYAEGRDHGKKKECFKIAVTNKYRVNFSKRCGADYAEGLIQRNEKECFKISILKDKYKTHPKGKCVFDYIEGQIREGKKECLKISTLKKEYKIHSRGKCAFGYIRGLYDKCFEIAVTNKYRVLPDKRCGADYAEGPVQGIEKECLKVSTLKDEYKTNPRSRCAFDYRKILKSDDKNNKYYCKRKGLENR